MVESTDDLFFVDAHTACRDLIEFAQSNPGMTLERIEGTVDYLLTLMPIVGLEPYIPSVKRFAATLPELEDGASRRFARDLGEWLTLCLEQIKQGETLERARDAHPELYERVKARSNQGPNTSNDANHTLGLETVGEADSEPPIPPVASIPVDSTPVDLTPVDSIPVDSTPVDSDFLEDAVRTIEAVDALTEMMFRGSSDRQESEQLPIEAIPDSPGFEEEGSWFEGVDEGIAHTSSEQEIPSEHDEDQTPTSLGYEETPPQPEPLETFTQPVQQAPLPQPLATAAKPLALSARSVASEPSPLSLARDLRLRVDDAFRRALKLLPDDRWPEGALGLLESIDVFDHVSLDHATPANFELIVGKEIRIDWELALGLKQSLKASQSEGLIEARLVAHTLLLSFKAETPVELSALADLCALYGGRVDVNSTGRQCRAVIPASKRLLRVAPVQVREEWIAVSWSQMISTGSVPGVRTIELQLRLGSDVDRLIIKELGMLQVGVFYPLHAEYRKRDRFRGVVRLPNGQSLPVYA